MTDNEITEAYFVARGRRKIKSHALSLGYRFMILEEEVWVEHDDLSKIREGDAYYNFLPSILESYSAFKEHVLERMENEEYTLQFVDYKKGMGVRWKGWEHMKVYTEVIKDLEILRAAVIAATRYFEEKK